MKAAALMVLLLWQAAPANEPPVAQPGHLRYLRALAVPTGAGQACAVLDAQVFPHAEPALIDLRIFPRGAAQHEVAYAITMSQAVTEETQPARLLNLGSEGGKIVFDLEMPQRAYSDVALDLDPNATNFLATATVTGMDELGGKGRSTALGSFTLFDLSSQHLSRDTTLPLEESTFRYLHVVLSVSPAPGSAPGAGPAMVPAMVRGAQVPPSREEQILYTTVAQTSSLETVGRESRATFEIPPRVPVERVEFVLAPGFKGNFSRDVKVTATAEPLPKGATQAGTAEGGVDNDEREPLAETVTGNILRVHANEAGREIRTEELGFPAVLGANLQRPAKVEVAIENGDDQPLPIAQVRLEMRQRELCFDAGTARGAGVELALYYGDPALLGPVYDYERLFVAADKPLAATLGPEQLNPQYTPRPQAPLSFTERHPQVLWIALIGAICALGLVAIRSSRNVGRSS
jgi:hypothetical protein